MFSIPLMTATILCLLIGGALFSLFSILYFLVVIFETYSSESFIDNTKDALIFAFWIMFLATPGAVFTMTGIHAAYSTAMWSLRTIVIFVLATFLGSLGAIKAAGSAGKFRRQKAQ